MHILSSPQLSEKMFRRNLPDRDRKGHIHTAPLAASEVNGGWCQHLLAELTQSELEDLAVYARFRLNRAGLPPGMAEDVRQNALLAVLLGSRSRRHGRHPREADLTDRSSFIWYLKGVICSLIEGLWRSSENRFVFVSLESETLGAGELTSHESAASEDLAQQLFARLQKTAPRRLLPTIRQWAAHWRECEVIPLAGKHRRYRQELRVLAIKVLKEVSHDRLDVQAECQINHE